MVKILRSGLTGRTGVEAIRTAKDRDDVGIVAGIRREICGGIDYEGAIDFNLRTGFEGKWHRYRDLNNIMRPQPEGFDVIVDFSHPDVFEQIVELAVRTHVPLISGTSGLSDRQMALLYDATNQIPVFRGGNFRFKVKPFIDAAVKFAETHDTLGLLEQIWSAEAFPSEIAKTISQKVLRATGKTMSMNDGWSYDPKLLINEWILSGEIPDDNHFHPSESISCKVIGFGELAHDVLEIAKIMKNKPIREGKLYDLDEIWDEIPAAAKKTS